MAANYDSTETLDVLKFIKDTILKQVVLNSTETLDVLKFESTAEGDNDFKQIQPKHQMY